MRILNSWDSREKKVMLADEPVHRTIKRMWMCPMAHVPLCVSASSQSIFEHNSSMDNERMTMDTHAILLDFFASHQCAATI